VLAAAQDGGRAEGRSGMKIFYCDACNGRFTEDDVNAGKAVATADQCLCPQCALQANADGNVVISEEVFTFQDGEEAPPMAEEEYPRTARRRYSRQPASRAKGIMVVALIAVIFVVGALIALLALSGPAGTSGDGQGDTGTKIVVSVKPKQTAQTKPAAQGPDGQTTPARKPLGEDLPTPGARRPLGESLPTPGPASPSPPAPKAAPRPAPKAAPPTAPKAPPVSLTPVSGAGWISIFNGNDLEGWRTDKADSGRAEGGSLVSSQGADLYYAADWGEFMLECELKGENPSDSRVGGLNLAQWGMGRGSGRVKVTFHNDGDVHVNLGKDKERWRSGGGRFDPGNWTKVRFELRRNDLKVYSGDELVGTLDVSSLPVRNGGLYMYSGNDATFRMRNPRVKVLSK
jgi:hypothetical protein